MAARKYTLPVGYSSPRWSAEMADCSMPMCFDQYSMCGFGCFYCFALYQKAIGVAKKNFLAQNLRTVDMRYINRVFSGGEGSSQFWKYVKERKVMQWGSLADPFCPIEKKYGVGLEIMRYLRELDYPIRFSTKGTWWLEDSRYTELFEGNKKWTVMFSIITLDEEKAFSVEKGVPSPMERLRAIEKCAELDPSRVILRFRPYMIGISDYLLSGIAGRHADEELISLAAGAGATAVSTEFFCLEQRSPILRKNLKLFNRIAGFDYWDFYKRYSYATGYLRLNRKVKREIMDRLEHAAHANGMEFYVSDAHFKERCDGGSCCGLRPDQNYSRGQFCEALQICRRRGEVRWSDIKDDMESLKTFLWRKADGYNTGGCEQRASFHTFTMYDYMRWLWNNPKVGQSPYTMFEGVMKPSGKDENGDLIYYLGKERM